MQTNSKREAIKFERERVIRECAQLNVSQNTNQKYKSYISFDIPILYVQYIRFVRFIYIELANLILILLRIIFLHGNIQ